MSCVVCTVLNGGPLNESMQILGHIIRNHISSSCLSKMRPPRGHLLHSLQQLMQMLHVFVSTFI